MILVFFFFIFVLRGVGIIWVRYRRERSKLFCRGDVACFFKLGRRLFGRFWGCWVFFFDFIGFLGRGRVLRVIVVVYVGRLGLRF